MIERHLLELFLDGTCQISADLCKRIIEIENKCKRHPNTKVSIFEAVRSYFDYKDDSDREFLKFVSKIAKIVEIIIRING